MTVVPVVKVLMIIVSRNLASLVSPSVVKFLENVRAAALAALFVRRYRYLPRVLYHHVISVLQDLPDQLELLDPEQEQQDLPDPLE